MIQKELCEAIISSDYVVDDLFNEDQLKIPRNQQLIYTIELLDWENEYLSRKNDGGVLRTYLNLRNISRKIIKLILYLFY